MKKINFVLIGSGNIAKVHYCAIKNVKEANLFGVLSLSGKSNFINNVHLDNVKVFESLKDVMQCKEIDAVDIISTNNLHAKIGIKAAVNKKHVLVEKPIALSMNDADKLITECKKNKVKLSVMSQNRFSDQFIEFRKKIMNDELEKIYFGFCLWSIKRNRKYYIDSPWRKNKKMSGGGVLMMNMIHYIDLLQWCLGPVESVFGEVYNHRYFYEVEDTVRASLRFRNNLEITIYGTTATNYSLAPEIKIFGKENNYTVQDSNYEIASKKLFTKQIKNFTLSIINNKEPAVSGEVAKESLGVVLAIYKSALFNKEILIKKI